MKSGLLWCFVYGSLALAQSGPGQSEAEARRGCALLEQRFKDVRSQPALEPGKMEREARFQALVKLHEEAPKAHVRDSTRLPLSPGSQSSSLAVEPIHELAIVGECGSGWSLLSVLIRGHEFEYFETGYLRTDKLLMEPPSCQHLTSWLYQAPYRLQSFLTGPEEPLYVVGSVVMVREGPDSSAAVLQKLGYGVTVNAVSRACGDWLLVSSPFGGYGFIHKDFLSATPYDEATLRARQARVPSLQEQSLWALARAHFFPSDSSRTEALALQTKVREALSSTDQGRCERFVGACEVLLGDSMSRKKRLDSDPEVGQVPPGPWWVLRATGAARVAVFRGAYVYTPGECDCCGCVACQTTLNVALEALGEREQAQVLAASRRPPPSWFHEVSQEGCARAEQVARKSPRWDVPAFAGDKKKRATPGQGTCIPGDDGSIWWQQVWHHPEMDGESNEVLRTYRIAQGRVVEVGKLTAAQGDVTGTVAWTTQAIAAWRDIDGDGRSEAIIPCQFGSYCTQARGFTRAGP